MNKIFEGYDGFNNISKSKSHIVTTNNLKGGVGICDLNSNCSNLELKISGIEKDGDLIINSVQSNKTNIKENFTSEKQNGFSYELVIIIILIIMMIYFLRK